MIKMNTNLSVMTMLFGVALFAACSGESSDADSGDGEANGSSTSATIEGEWKLVNFESDGSNEKFTECDEQTVWNFTGEAADPLQDGTETQKIVATAPEDCKFFGFESNWALPADGQVYITSTRVGGTGGASNAGLFNIEELTADKLVLKAFSNVYTFGR